MTNPIDMTALAERLQAFSPAGEILAAGSSILLMGLCGVRLLRRFVRVLRGEEAAQGALEGGRATARELIDAACVTLLSRLFLYALAYVLYRVTGVGDSGFEGSFDALWIHWDTRHYVGIAEEGYSAVGDERLRLVFFPLYPLLMRLFAPLAGSAFRGGIVVSLLCASLAGALLYDLCRMHAGRDTARLALTYFLVNPASVFLCCAYTEALFLCLTLSAVCLLRRDRPWAAALCGALSAFTRMPGVVVAGLFLIRLLGDAPRRRVTPGAALCCAGQMLAVFSGLLAYWAVNLFVTGDPFTYMIYQAENWYQEPGAFWASAANTAHYFLTCVGEPDWLFTWGFQLLTMFYAFALLAFREDALPFDLAAYSFVYLAVVFSPTWLLSGARYLYALCALPLLQARAHRHPAAHALALGVSAALLVVWVYGYTVVRQVL